jgi:hypothetical protein
MFIDVNTPGGFKEIKNRSYPLSTLLFSTGGDIPTFSPKAKFSVMPSQDLRVTKGV